MSPWTDRTDHCKNTSAQVAIPMLVYKQLCSYSSPNRFWAQLNAVIFELCSRKSGRALGKDGMSRNDSERLIATLIKMTKG